MIELESDPEVMKFTPVRGPLSPEQTEQRLKALVDKEDSYSPFGVWAVELKDTADFVGWFMLLKTGHEFPELGFMIVQRHWGHGFATEAATGLIEFGFRELKLKGIIATTNPDNFASKKVLGKLGFIFSKSISVPDKVLQRDIQLDVFEILR